MKNILRHHDVFMNVSLRYETNLIRSNQIVDKRFHPIDSIFCEQLIATIIQRNMAKLSNHLRTRSFRNQTKISKINLSNTRFFEPQTLDEPIESIPCHVLSALIEIRLETIRPKGFPSHHTEESMLDFHRLQIRLKELFVMGIQTSKRMLRITPCKDLKVFGVKVLEI